ncbi:hypothetical protein BCR32DRAFT_263785 [Anaeromyces robustus]|uniref:Uncharacterized protein n=1 Tax=Anaeromyces robustus TaxID=1754192 RepID=A0A1Y1XQQ4_9FUNG|nr:hypothetical protein BCR32DRAFT_263785 [Anaeromyces robustus]|eukprot:ORX88109.1 hypothetical protein BCR32DRAFT_263785 [Anaeromyces robustus]
MKKLNYLLLYQNKIFKKYSIKIQFILIILFIFSNYIFVEAHYIDDDDKSSTTDIVDLEFDIFKTFLNNLGINILNDDIKNEFNNDNELIDDKDKENKFNNDNELIDDKDKENKFNNDNELIDDKDKKLITSEIDNNKEKEKINNVTDEESKKYIENNENINNIDDIKEKNKENHEQINSKIIDNPEENYFKNDEDESYEYINKDDDDDIKELVKSIVESEGKTGEEAIEQESDMIKKIKEAINNNALKTHNSKLDKLAKAKEEDMKKGIDFSKISSNYNNKNKNINANKTETNNDNNNNGVFKIEDPSSYRCFFDQDCTNFRGFTPEVAHCNGTSHHCENYCFVQKACLYDYDCSTSCGSWCLKEDDMVFGRCVMTFEENDFCMESWRVCDEGLICNVDTYVCEKERISYTFTRIDSQESLLSIIVFLIIAIYLIKNSRNRDFVSFFSGYNLNEYCTNNPQEYDPLPEYRRTEEINPDEMNDLVEHSSVNNDEPMEGEPMEYPIESDTQPIYYEYDENNNTINCNYIPVRPAVVEQTCPQNDNDDINVHAPSVSSLSDSDLINDPPPDYEE